MLCYYHSSSAGPGLVPRPRLCTCSALHLNAPLPDRQAAAEAAAPRSGLRTPPSPPYPPLPRPALGSHWSFAPCLPSPASLLERALGGTGFCPGQSRASAQTQPGRQHRTLGQGTNDSGRGVRRSSREVPGQAHGRRGGCGHSPRAGMGALRRRRRPAGGAAPTAAPGGGRGPSGEGSDRETRWRRRRRARSAHPPRPPPPGQ